MQGKMMLRLMTLRLDHGAVDSVRGSSPRAMQQPLRMAGRPAKEASPAAIAVITIKGVAAEQLVTAATMRAHQRASCIRECLSMGAMRHSFHFL